MARVAVLLAALAALAVAVPQTGTLKITDGVRQARDYRLADVVPARVDDHGGPRIEPAFGWLKAIAWLRKVKLRGLSNVHWLVCFAAAAFNLRRLTTLMAA